VCTETGLFGFQYSRAGQSFTSSNRGVWLNSTTGFLTPLANGTYLVMGIGRLEDPTNGDFWSVRLATNMAGDGPDVQLIVSIGSYSNLPSLPPPQASAPVVWIGELYAGQTVFLQYFVSGSGTGQFTCDGDSFGWSSLMIMQINKK
jgi:hypothetical protein